MKICRFEREGTQRLGLVEASMVRDLAGALAPEDFRATPAQLGALAEAGATAPSLPLDAVRLLRPLSRPGTVFAVGLNYRHHAIEQGKPIPDEPTLFIKPPGSLSGPFDPIRPSPVSDTLDYEGELVAVLGKPLFNASEANAAAAITGWCLMNDVSVRAFVKPTMLPVGKGGIGHGPIGPWITTADEIADPAALEVRTLVNGTVRQHSPASDMIFAAPEVIALLSKGIALKPGNMVSLGSPGGSGIGMKPPVWLRTGDVVRVECDALGAIENRVETA